MNFERQANFIGTWGWRLICSSLFWLLGNLLYVFLILNLLLAGNINEIGTLVITAIVLIPPIFSPGTVATFSCIRSMLNDEDSRKLFDVYKSSYRQNFRVSFLNGAVYSTGIFVIYTCYWYYSQMTNLGYVLPLLLLAVLTVVFFFTLMYTSDREETILGYWKKSFFILLNHPILAFFMGTEIFFVIFFCHYIGALLLFAAPGGVLLIVYYFYNECIHAEERKSSNGPMPLT